MTNSWLANPKVQAVLASLYKDSAENDAINRKEANELPDTATSEEFYTAMRKVYMAVGADFGNMLYALARATKAKTIVEFGTSFGVSTIYLAAAVKDNGGGKVITTEFHPEKAAKAKQNLTEAGLAEYVEFRVGDALQTLKQDKPQNVDLLFLDGPKGMYLDVLKLMQDQLRSGGILASDNTDHDGLQNYLAYIRNSDNGYISSPMHTKRGERFPAHEVSVKV
ncbi:O-methyltransferase [Bdellovibrio sp. HCB274]|uniref:O-methyltransferase n=1 Tax=Bdellovibrio sp. HCB274 TaxID=3394361 RepID=UPI0039B39546